MNEQQTDLAKKPRRARKARRGANKKSRRKSKRSGKGKRKDRESAGLAKAQFILKQRRAAEKLVERLDERLRRALGAIRS